MVYIKDQNPPPVGVNPVWRTVYLPTVFVVTNVYTYKCVLLKIVDNTTTVRSFNQIKRYKEYPELDKLPLSLRELFKGGFPELTPSMLGQLLKNHADTWANLKEQASFHTRDTLDDGLSMDNPPVPEDGTDGATASSSDESSSGDEHDENPGERGSQDHSGRRYPHRRRRVRFKL